MFNIISADAVSAVEVTAIDVQQTIAQQNAQKTADDDLRMTGCQLLDGLVNVSKIFFLH